MLSVSRAKSPAREQAERKDHRTTPAVFLAGITSEQNRCKPCKSPGAEQVKNNLKKFKKVLDNVNYM